MEKQMTYGEGSDGDRISKSWIALKWTVYRNGALYAKFNNNINLS